MTKWWKSKTIWLNIIIVILAAIQAIQGEAWFNPAIQAAIVAILETIMRLLTSQPIAGTPAAKKLKG